MSKIPFDIKYRPQIESGEYKVETRDGKKVRVLCYDANNIVPIVALVTFNDGSEGSRDYYSNGTMDYDRENPLDLFIVTPEEELTEWEKAIKDLVLAIDEGELREFGGFEEENLRAWAVKKASELLSLAHEQFIKDGYIIEKKAFHDAVENISDKHQAEMSVEYSLHCKVENGTRHAIMNWDAFQKVAQKFINIGKAEALRTGATELTENLIKSGLDKDSIPYHLIEFMCNLYTCPNWKEIEETAELYTTRIKAAALKDLPRWRAELGDMEYVSYGIIGGGVASTENPRVFLNGRSIDLYSLEKLPGFKED